MKSLLVLLLFTLLAASVVAAEVFTITTEKDESDASEVDYSSSEEDSPMEDVGMEEENEVVEERVEDRVHASIMAALRRPDMKKQMGQILPIIRAMSPPQRLTLAALITSQVMDASPPTLNEVSAMFGIAPDTPDHIKRNITSTLLLPLSFDIARMFKGNYQAPQAQQYRSFRPPPPPWSHRRPPPGPNRRNTHVYTAMLPPPPPRSRQPPVDLTIPPDKDHCEFFSSSLCLEVTDYPREAILASLRASEGALDDVLTPDRRGEEFSSNVADRRQDGAGPSSMCSSVTKLARPKKARTTGGQWKYIVNTGHYVQTLRLEMCQNPQQSCSYISDNFRSECSQVYNYHRLLTWDESKGLHMDVFKVPTCCSCQVNGYSVNFPPKDIQNTNVRAPEHHPVTEFAIENSFGGSNEQQYQNFNVEPVSPHGHAHFDETQLFKQGSIVEQSLREHAFNGPPQTGGNSNNIVRTSVQGVGETPPGFGQGGLPPHYANNYDPFRTGQGVVGYGDPPYGNILKREDTAPHSAEVQPPSFENNIRRSRNQTGYTDKRLYTSGESSSSRYRPEHDIVRGVPMAPNGIPLLPTSPPSAPRRPAGMNPGRRVPPRPPYQYIDRTQHPGQDKSPALERPPQNTYRRNDTQYSNADNYANVPNQNENSVTDFHQTTEAAKPKGDGKRVNYSYHPIIDFFKTTRLENDKLESRSGEGWRPIIGPTK